MSEKQSFIKENIVRKNRRGKIIKRILSTIGLGILFGIVAIVVAVITKPYAEKYLGKEPETTVVIEQIIIPRDVPEAQTEQVTAQIALEAETEPVKEIVENAISEYEYSIEDANSLWGSVVEVGNRADHAIVSVAAIHEETDWFDNEIETLGSCSGIIIGKTSAEILILSITDEITDADELRVTFGSSNSYPAHVKSTDRLTGLAVIAVRAIDVPRSERDNLEPITLGNSYKVKKGDILIAIGCPQGIIHSSSCTFATYIEKNHATPDGKTEVILADKKVDTSDGTWIVNTAGELVGWAGVNTDEKYNEELSIIYGISDYKAYIERMMNGKDYAYFGVYAESLDRELIVDMEINGVYVSEVISDSPAYDAGVQPGDIIVSMENKEILGLDSFITAIEKSEPDTDVTLLVKREKPDGYKDIAFEVSLTNRR